MKVKMFAGLILAALGIGYIFMPRLVEGDECTGGIRKEHLGY